MDRNLNVNTQFTRQLYLNMLSYKCCIAGSCKEFGKDWRHWIFQLYHADPFSPAGKLQQSSPMKEAPRGHQPAHSLSSTLLNNGHCVRCSGYNSLPQWG